MKVWEEGLSHFLVQAALPQQAGTLPRLHKPSWQSLWHSPYPGTAVGHVELLLNYLWYFLTRSSLALCWTLSTLAAFWFSLFIGFSSAALPFFSLGLLAVTKPNILPFWTTHSLSNGMLLCVSVCESCHCYLTLLSGTPSKYQLCTSYMPQSLEYLTETSIFCSFAITALLRLSLFPDLISDSAGVCHFQAFPPFYLLFILGFFSPPLLSMLLLHASSFSPSLTFVSTILWFVFSHSHPCWWPSGSQLCLFLFSTWLWLRPEEWVQFISQINAFHAATCLPSCISSSALPLLQFVLLKDKQPQNCICFPCAVSLNINHHFHAVCISSPGGILALILYWPCSHTSVSCCVCVFSLLAFLCWRNSHKAM